METVIGVPIPVLVKIPYERLVEAGGSLRAALESSLSPFEGSTCKKWKLADCRLSVLDGCTVWRGPRSHSDEMDDTIVETEESIYGSAAYFEDVEDLTDLPDAVLAEDGTWHEPSPYDRSEFRRNFMSNFMEGTEPNTMLAVVYCWSQSDA